ncbi:ABC transporter ATP-binding protein [Lactiplantibacillus mudanjiangensis]|uniref:Spermidine/putrescine ABC transporter ATP-binding protein [Lactobacillus pentosus] n=1 Tax=Lactiplantibacillus mudanjiangensis TaxID=1296538 RepID=A0A660DZ07_9LACO|nr:ATP-binding cassette domain-containing protein [Lactiplantibacillus mudanjiangensis]VDG19626.1 spermidine/putrescine ABC transporter ATP-binding protein [Lactobacillus pentosus] [Lactiplantibacillus mudanjiangensis]VDG25534.1 spermidine/putrescine ABC transporter ATP-binding protein [Lactobacillus pentosus] [Lactiplantibacillus mudanjiangensis]VDG28543.1 spermidine/putrescine ABC transporter ATP-binding protein [Lactobacillus pentosus] [Lactiplantibacillus mudanjiangensis]VDG31072.1 spermidi
MNVFELEQVSYVPNDHHVLDEIIMTVPAGDYLTITGPSGSGKSTLLRLLASLLTPTSGQLNFMGQPQSSYDKPTYRKRVSYCFQQPTLFGETVQDNLAFPFTIRGLPFDQLAASAALDKVDLTDRTLTQPIVELSGGEKQRVALIRNLMFPPEVLLLDEVTAGLDKETKTIVHRLIDDYHRQQLTILSVTHDDSELASATNMIEIRDGRLEGQHD